MGIRNKVIAGAMTAAALGVGLVVAPTADAATGSCASYDACLYYNSNFQGAIFGDSSGTSQGADNYGSPNWYTFGGGNGAGLPVKNNAASVWDFDPNYSVTIYYYSNMATGPSQYFKRGTGGNLNSTMKNNNASQCFDFYQVCP